MIYGLDCYSSKFFEWMPIIYAIAKGCSCFAIIPGSLKPTFKSTLKYKETKSTLYFKVNSGKVLLTAIF
jgi:hypothetical protein